MKDEIKEILEGLNHISNSGENASIEFNSKDCKLLSNYITNLQEELKSANESITWWTNRFNAVEKENKKLKETNVYCNRTDCIGRIKDSRKYDSVYQEKEDYKSRIDKAIEYLTDKNREFSEDCYYKVCELTETEDLLNILNGSDKDE